MSALRTANYKFPKVASVALLIAALLFAGCGRPDPQPLRFRDVPWQDGDAFLFDITDVNGNYAGTALYTIGSSGVSAAGSWMMRRETNAQGNQEIVAVETTGDYLRPLHTQWSLESGSGLESIEVRYKDGLADMTLISKQQQMHTEQRNIPTNSYDLFTQFMLLRALPLDNNYATQISLFNPTTGQLDFVTISVLKNEEIAAIAGTYRSWQVEIKSESRTSKAWIGTEAPYPVVRYIDGGSGGTYDLSTFEPGK